MRGRLLTLAAALALLTAGFLAGSFWLEWRHTELADDGAPEAVPATPMAGPDAWESRVRVEVLNGMGVSGEARRAAGLLREMGFDVVYFGNADRFDREETVVLDRSGRTGAARSLADSLGVEEVLDRPEPDLYLDGTVILGRDWRDRLEARARASSPEDGGRSALERIRERLGL